jgi:pimeloyl-ACP methyl ester carboxylesterase
MMAREKQTGYSHPIPKAGIGGSPPLCSTRMMRILYLHGFASGPDSTKATMLRNRFAAAGVPFEVPDINEDGLEQATLGKQLSVVERAARGERVGLIGSSLGGYVAALYAARHPEVERVLLLAPAFGFATLMLDTLGPERAGEWRRKGWLDLAEDDRTLRVPYSLIEDGLQYEQFPATTQPVLIFHGTRDSEVPYTLSQGFARRTANVTLKPVDSDHRLIDAVDRIWNAALVFFGLNHSSSD